MRKRGRYEKVNPKKGGKGKKILLAVVCLLVLAIGGIAAFALGFLDHALDQMHYVEVPKVEYTQPTTEPVATETQNTLPAETTEPIPTETEYVPSSADFINFLIVGQAARQGETERFADTMILVTFNTHTKSVTLTSLLRDTFVKMPDYKGHYGGRIKLTTIYHLGSVYGGGVAGSMELMNMTLYNNFGIEVDYNFEIDFEVFVKVINLMGGVKIELTEEEAAYLNNLDLWQEVVPGKNLLYGEAALCYARMRKAEGDGDSDIKRTERQRKLIEAVFTRLVKLSPTELRNIVDEILPLIVTSMTKDEITDFIIKFLPMLPEMQFQKGGTCPANYSGDMVDIYKDGMQHSVLRFDEQETKSHMRALTEGEQPAK